MRGLKKELKKYMELEKRILGENDGDLIYALQRKAYIKETIRRIAKNLRMQEKMEERNITYEQQLQ